MCTTVGAVGIGKRAAVHRSTSRGHGGDVQSWLTRILVVALASVVARLCRHRQSSNRNAVAVVLDSKPTADIGWGMKDRAWQKLQGSLDFLHRVPSKTPTKCGKQPPKNQQWAQHLSAYWFAWLTECDASTALWHAPNAWRHMSSKVAAPTLAPSDAMADLFAST